MIRHARLLSIALFACGGQLEDAPDAGALDAGGRADADAATVTASDAASPADAMASGPPPAVDASSSVDSGAPLRYATIYGETLTAGGPSVATAELSSVVGTPAVCTLSIPPSSCAVATCGYAGADPTENAGPIVVSDGALTTTLTYSAGPPASYDTWQGSSAGWSAPSTLTFSAGPSAALPLGLMHSLPFPAATTLTTPEWSTMAVIDTTSPLALAWSPTSAPEVVLVVEAQLAESPDDYAFLACVFDGAAGHAEVASSYLGAMKGMARGSTSVAAGFLTVTRVLDVEQGWAIELAAFGPGGADADVTLE